MSLLLKGGQYFGKEVKERENDFLKFTITHYQPGTAITEHYHENHYLSLLINGKYQEQHKSEDALLESGSVIFRPSGYNHANNFGKAGGACFNIEFKENWQQNINLKLSLPAKHIVYKTGSLPAIYKLLYAFNNSFVASSEADIYFELVLDWLCWVNQPVPVKPKSGWIEKVMLIIQNEPENHHTIQALADRVCTHPIYLARAFKQKTGLTIGEYQLKFKLEKAVALLFNTNLPVSEIAFLAGFFDAAHFIHSFKFIYQTTPQTFRLGVKG